jgi:hypothetical protein
MPWLALNNFIENTSWLGFHGTRFAGAPNQDDKKKVELESFIGLIIQTALKGGDLNPKMI